MANEMLMLPCSLRGRWADVETVSEVLKKYKGKSLGKNIRNLMFRGYVEHSNLTPSNFFMNEINIHLNVFRSLMLNRITQEIDSTGVITIDQGSLMNRVV
jgi:hypothetical protein